MHHRLRRRHLVALCAAMVGGAALTMSPVTETLANFQDNEYASGAFTGSKWNIQQSRDRTASGAGTWDDQFTFANKYLTNSATALYPGAPANFAAVSLRVAAGSTPTGASVKMSAGVEKTTTGNAGKIRLRAAKSADHGCGSSTFTSSDTGNYIVGGPSTYGTLVSAPNSGRDTFTLAPATATVAGADTTICLEMTVVNDASTDALNGNYLEVEWTFSGSAQ